MSDIRTRWKGLAGDWSILGASLEEDDGLESAVAISLFSDARAAAGDPLPDPPISRRGWWGDAFAEVPGDKIGSRLWLLSREKQIDKVLGPAEVYARESLAWLVADGIARSVKVAAEISGEGVLGLAVEIARADQPVARYRFEGFWGAA